MSEELSPAIDAAFRWVHAAIEAGDLAAAWPITDPGWRLLLAQSWMIDSGLDHRSDRDLLAAGIAADPPTSPHWTAFASWYGGHLGGTHSQLPRWGALSTTELAAPDVEVVTLVEEAVQGVVVAGDPAMLVQRVTVRLGPDSVWRLCAIGRSIPLPGWPPQADELDP